MSGPMKPRQTRLDHAMVARGMAESRAGAQALVYAGQVRVDGQTVRKPSAGCAPGALIELESGPRFVSRGGLKLDHALDYFKLDVCGRICLDIGASTGGFTDCLLKRGAARVYAVDVGRGLLHWRLRNDPRVVSIEGVNARRLDPDVFVERPEFACADVSFISLRKVLPAADAVLREDADIVVLIKPQFEAGREDVCRGGVVRDPEVRARVAAEIRIFAVEVLGWAWLGMCDSPVAGPAGNLEMLAMLRKGGVSNGERK